MVLLPRVDCSLISAPYCIYSLVTLPSTVYTHHTYTIYDTNYFSNITDFWIQTSTSHDNSLSAKMRLSLKWRSRKARFVSA